LTSSKTPDGLEAADVLDTTLYADLIEADGLAAALRAIARETGLDLGPVEPSDQWGRAAFVTARTISDRGPIAVLLGLDKRRFSLSLGSRQAGHGWAEGGTSDLIDAARAIDAWRQGAKLREMAARFAFVEYPPLSQAYEDGTQVQSQWQELLTAPEYAEHHGLLQRLHADSEIRKLFPFFSMGALRLAKDSVDYSLGEIIVKPRSGGGEYAIASSSAPEESPAANVEGVVEQARSLLPELGPGDVTD